MSAGVGTFWILRITPPATVYNVAIILMLAIAISNDYLSCQTLMNVLKTMDATPMLCVPILLVAISVSVKLVMRGME